LTGRPIKEIYPLISDVRKDPVKTKKVQRGQLVIPKRVRPLQEPHKRYLRARNFSPAEIEEVWSVKGIGIDTQLAWRLWIPIIQNRETVSWTTRTIDPDNEMRYISASPKEEAVPHKEVLYGEDYCRSAIIITEGPTDVWRIGKGAVATFGLGFEPAQVKRMLQYPVRVVCFDNSKEAQKRAKKLAGTLSLYKGETYVVNLSADDAGSASPEEIKELRSRFL
jgi:DNA primase